MQKLVVSQFCATSIDLLDFRGAESRNSVQNRVGDVDVGVWADERTICAWSTCNLPVHAFLIACLSLCVHEICAAVAVFNGPMTWSRMKRWLWRFDVTRGTLNGHRSRDISVPYARFSKLKTDTDKVCIEVHGCRLRSLTGLWHNLNAVCWSMQDVSLFHFREISIASTVCFVL